jgi:hypothetical protein
MAATAGHRLTVDPMRKCSNAFFSETTNMIKAKLYMNVYWMVFYSIIVANRKTNYNDLRTVSLNKTNCSYLINRTHLIVLSVVLRQQRGYLFLHTFSYFHSWDLQLSSVCVIHSNGIIGKMQLD